MFGIWKFVKRNWESASPKEVPKLDGALKIGLFGASKIAYVTRSTKGLYTR